MLELLIDNPLTGDGGSFGDAGSVVLAHSHCYNTDFVRNGFQKPFSDHICCNLVKNSLKFV